MSMIDVAKKLSVEMPSGWVAYIVGGAVRDICMGQNPHDIDIEVFGATPDELVEFAQRIDPRADVVGKSFGVVKLKYRLVDFDLSIPRTETKRGTGHKGFDVTPDPNMSTREACARRDYTINSMMLRLPKMDLVDHYGGRRAIQFKYLIPTSKHFAEDPLRILRGMQFAARFRLKGSPDLIKYGKQLLSEYDTLPKERVWHEWDKWARAMYPSMGLRVLRDTGWITTVPYLGQLVGLEQDVRHHPEGWSINELFVPLNPLAAGMTKTRSIDGAREVSQVGELTQGPPAAPAMIPSVSCASRAESLVDNPINCLSSANIARALSLLLSHKTAIAVVTHAARSVWAGDRTALGAHKCLRIVLEIPMPRVLSIVESSINDFEILKRIIHPVAIYVMNMLGPVKLSAEKKYHEVSMQPNGAALSIDLLSEINVLISSIVMDLKPDAVNNSVLFYYDLALERDFDFRHVSSCNIDYDTTHTMACKPCIGDVYSHVLHAVDAVVSRQESLVLPLTDEDRAICVFAALCHDFGKISTTVHEDDGSITSRGHDVLGETMALEFMEAIGAPKEIALKVSKLVRWHMRHIFTTSVSRRTVRRLARDLYPATIEQWAVVAYADQSSRPPKPVGMHKNAQAIVDMAEEMSIEFNPPEHIMLGRHLIDIGMKPGKEFGVILSSAYEAQLDGEFSDTESGLVWIQNHLQENSNA